MDWIRTDSRGDRSLKQWIMLGLVLMHEIPHPGRRWPPWDDIDRHPIFPVQVAEVVALHSSDSHEKAITTDSAASGPVIKLDTRTFTDPSHEDQT